MMDLCLKDAGVQRYHAVRIAHPLFTCSQEKMPFYSCDNLMGNSNQRKLQKGVPPSLVTTFIFTAFLMIFAVSSVNILD